MKTIIKEKMKMVENFMRSVKSLSASQPINEITENEYMKKDLFKNSMTCYYLGALIFELLIKIFYELEHKKSSKKTHDLKVIYECLSGNDKNFIHKRYEFSKKKLEQFIASQYNNKSEIPRIIYADLDESLTKNKKIVTDFKYSMAINEKAAIYVNLFLYDDMNKHPLVIPHNYHSNFLNELLKETYNKIIENDPQEANVFFDRGVVNFDLHQRKEALKDFTKAKQLFEKEKNELLIEHCNAKIDQIILLSKETGGQEDLFLCFKVPV